MSSVRLFVIDCDPGATLGGACIRDAANLSNFFMQKLNVDPSSIRVLLTEYNSQTHKSRPYLPLTFPSSVATDGRSQNWESEYERFRSSVCKPNDTVVVCLTGHGYQKRDVSGDELDGMDEYVMVQTPENDGRSQVVMDDDFFRVLIESECQRAPQERVALRLISDTCHSGTMFDLPYSAKPLRVTELSKAMSEADVKIEYAHARKDFIRVQQLLKDVDVLAIGGCSDSGYGVNCVGTQVGFGGALTISLLEEVKMPHDPMQTVPESWPIVDFVQGRGEQAIRKITYGLRRHVQVPVLQVSSIELVQATIHSLAHRSEAAEVDERELSGEGGVSKRVVEQTADEEAEEEDEDEDKDKDEDEEEKDEPVRAKRVRAGFQLAALHAIRPSNRAWDGGIPPFRRDAFLSGRGSSRKPSNKPSVQASQSQSRAVLGDGHQDASKRKPKGEPKPKPHPKPIAKRERTFDADSVSVPRRPSSITTRQAHQARRETALPGILRFRR